ncbi:hypothetical protein M501DRAFT_997670 [Patellaria atrata CBS 101060]|uniref:Uncharacterized protein n=1 Tax=Patellaria atrata CBS 101060 TaxID=1346257 RepID=A0A9P4S4L6_9PEZI|nr:hypothetical protein M501DRAFT_997670 [Patellaria atrata CBS 101060]
MSFGYNYHPPHKSQPHTQSSTKPQTKFCQTKFSQHDHTSTSHIQSAKLHNSTTNLRTNRTMEFLTHINLAETSMRANRSYPDSSTTTTNPTEACAIQTTHTCPLCKHTATLPLLLATIPTLSTSPSSASSAESNTNVEIHKTAHQCPNCIKTWSGSWIGSFGRIFSM